ncbi:MAG: glycosyltransferase family 2 protein, partial [Promethearchaeota archaeon]
IKHTFEDNNPLISIIIPIYNEENSINNVIRRIPSNLNHEILLVDDGSTDSSIKKVKKIKDKYIKIIKHGQNKGYGAALLTGFNHANGEIIITIDSDGQHDPQEIPRLIKPIISNEADVVIGSRYLGKIHYSIPFHIKIGEYFIKKILKIFYNQEIANNQSGFRAFRKSLLTHFKEFYDCGMAFSTELLLKTLELQKKIIEVPISLKPRIYGTSYVNLFKILKRILICITIYGLRRFKISKKIYDKYFFFLFKK